MRRFLFPKPVSQTPGLVVGGATALGLLVAALWPKHNVQTRTTGLGSVGLGYTNGIPTTSDMIYDALNWADGHSSELAPIADSFAKISAGAIEGAAITYYVVDAIIPVFNSVVGPLIGVALPLISTGVGAVIGIVIAAVGIIITIFEALQRPATITMLNGQQIDVRDYPSVVQGAAQWVKDNPQAAMQLSTDQFANQASIFKSTDDTVSFFNTIRGFLSQQGIDNSDLDQVQINAAKLPGASELLRSVQVPAATVAAAASPALWPIYPDLLPKAFPAITSDDVNMISIATARRHSDFVASAQAWANNQIGGVTPAKIAAQYPQMLQSDVQTIIANYRAPILNGPYGHIGQNGSGSTSSSSSTATKVATGTAATVGVAGLGLVAYSIYNGVSVASTAKKAYRAVARKFKRNKRKGTRR